MNLGTLGLCSMLASCAYALVFLAVGRRYPSALHFRYWIASSAMYAVILVGFGCLPRPTGAVIDTLMYGALAATDVLILMGVRVFEGGRAFHPWMAALVAATMALRAGPPVLAAAGWVVPPFTVPAVSAAALSLAIGVVGLVIYRGHGTPMRRIAGAAMLAYVPGYAVALIGEWTMPGQAWLARVPLALDQLLLAVMNLGLLAMCGERAQQALRDAARLDPLTQLLNRAGLRAREKALVRAGTGVVAFDIDHFKVVNDRHGHAVGDEVLVELAHAARGGNCRCGRSAWASRWWWRTMSCWPRRWGGRTRCSTAPRAAGGTGWRRGPRGALKRPICARCPIPGRFRSICWPRPAENETRPVVRSYQKMP